MHWRLMRFIIVSRKWSSWIWCEEIAEAFLTRQTLHSDQLDTSSPTETGTLERQKHTQPINYQQLLKRKVRQESGIRGLKRFAHPDLLVPLAFSAMSSPSTDLEAALQQEFVSFQFRNGWALQPAVHLQTRLLVCSLASLNAWSGWACKSCRTVLQCD